MKIYNSETQILTDISNPNEINKATGRTNWLQTVLDNQAFKHLYFIIGAIPNCLPKYYKIVLSNTVDSFVGSYAKKRIGSIVEMTTQEKEQKDVLPTVDPLFAAKQDLQRDKQFCLSIYDEFLLANRANPALTVEQIVVQANTDVTIKVLIDSGAVSSLQSLIPLMPESTLSVEQKEYFLKKFNDYIASK